MVEPAPRLSEETKEPSGEGAATMRAPRQSSPKQGGIILNEHRRATAAVSPL